MATEDLNQPLDYLMDNEKNGENKGNVTWFQKTQTACSDMLGANDVIVELTQTLEADIHDEKFTCHRILLAYAHYYLGDIDTAIKFSDMSVRYFNSRGMNWYQAMSHWFLGILLCKQGGLDKSQIEIDHAMNILVKLIKEEEQLGNYEHKYDKQIIDIKKSHASAVADMTAAGCSLSNGEIIVPSDIFSAIIDRIKIDKDDFLDCFWREVCGLNPSDIIQVDKHFDHLNSMLKEKKDKHKKDEKRIVTNPYLNFLLAHCYNFRSCEEESQYPLALQFAWDAIKEFQSPASSYDYQLNKYNHALSRWYLGLLYRNRGDYYSCLIQLKKAKHLFFEPKEFFNEPEVCEVNIIQECLNMTESARVWPPELLNRPEIPKPCPNYHWVGLDHTPPPQHNRRATDR